MDNNFVDSSDLHNDDEFLQLSASVLPDPISLEQDQLHEPRLVLSADMNIQPATEPKPTTGLFSSTSTFNRPNAQQMTPQDLNLFHHPMASEIKLFVLRSEDLQDLLKEGQEKHKRELLQRINQQQIQNQAQLQQMHAFEQQNHLKQALLARSYVPIQQVSQQRTVMYDNNMAPQQQQQPMIIQQPQQSIIMPQQQQPFHLQQVLQHFQSQQQPVMNTAPQHSPSAVKQSESAPLSEPSSPEEQPAEPEETKKKKRPSKRKAKIEFPDGEVREGKRRRTTKRRSNVPWSQMVVKFRVSDNE